MMGLMIIPEFQNFWRIIAPESTLGDHSRVLISYLFWISGAGHNYWGGHGPPGPPSIYLTAEYYLFMYLLACCSFLVELLL